MHADGSKRRKFSGPQKPMLTKPSLKYQYTPSRGVDSFQGDLNLFWPSGWVRWVGRGSVYIPKANEWFLYMTWLYLLQSQWQRGHLFLCWKKKKTLYSCPKDTIIIPACPTHAPVATCGWVCVTIAKPSSAESQGGLLRAAVSPFISLERPPSSCIYPWPMAAQIGFPGFLDSSKWSLTLIHGSN